MAILSDKDLDRLDQLAEAAAPGPWEVDGRRVMSGEDHVAMAVVVNRQSRADLAFIAACDPETIRELIARAQLRG